MTDYADLIARLRTLLRCRCEPDSACCEACSAVDAVDDALEAQGRRLAEAEALIEDMDQREGCEGWGDDLRQRIDAFLGAADQPSPVRFSLDEEYADPPATHQSQQKINAGGSE